MFAVEFQAEISDVTIELPPQYRDRLRGAVRVIILAQEPTDGPDMIDQLLAHPLEAAQFAPFQRTEIYERH